MKNLLIILILMVGLNGFTQPYSPMYILAGQSSDNNTTNDYTILLAPYTNGNNYYYSTDSGENWNTVTVTESSNNTHFSTGIADDLYGIQKYGTLNSYGVYFENGETTPTQTSKTSSYPMGCWTDYSGESMMFCWVYDIEFTTNGGSTWNIVHYTSLGINNGKITGGGMSYSGDTMYVGASNNNYIGRSIDGGATWSTVTSTLSYYTRAIVCSANGAYVYRTNYSSATNELYKSTNAGSTWTSCSPVDGSNGGWNIGCSADGKYVLFLGSYKAAVSDDYGDTWTSVMTTESHLYSLGQKMVSKSGKYMVIGDIDSYGVYHISKDYGVTWSRDTISAIASDNYYIRAVTIEDN